MSLTCLNVNGNFPYVQCDQLDLRYIHYLQYIWIICDVIILMIILFLNFAVILLALEIIRKRLFPSFFALHIRPEYTCLLQLWKQEICPWMWLQENTQAHM